MPLLPVAGMKFYVGDAALEPTDVDFVESDFSGVTWTEVDGWSQMGPIGDGAALITTSLINRGRDVHQKGTASAPPMTNVFARIPDDPGQIALVAIAKPSNKSNYPFKLLGNESGVTTPSITYFAGLGMGSPEQGGGANTVRNLGITIQINSNLVEVDAVP